MVRSSPGPRVASGDPAVVTETFILLTAKGQANKGRFMCFSEVEKSFRGVKFPCSIRFRLELDGAAAKAFAKEIVLEKKVRIRTFFGAKGN
ncbi:hypothetical protein Trydic_g4000 [Trypoxylus dichotomus]